MDYENIIWIKTEIPDEVSTVPDPTVQVCPSTINVKEELQECVNREYLADPLRVSKSTDCVKEVPELNLGPQETEKILCVPEFDPQLIKKEVFESENDCFDECDPLGITDDKDITSETCTPHRTWLTKITNETENIASEETNLRDATSNKLNFAAENSSHFHCSGTPIQVIFSKQDSEVGSRNNSSKVKQFKGFACSSCKEIFFSKYCLIMHVFIHIDGVQPPAHICRNCGEVFPTHDSLFDHSMEEKESRRDDCHQSSAITNQWGNQQWNMACTAERPLSRNFSNKSFATGDSLRRHSSDVSRESTNNSSATVINCAEKPYACDVCGISFAMSTGLKKHLIIHTGKRPHKCRVCGLSFIRAAHVKDHALIHTGEKPHKCDICGKSFTVSSHLRRHATVHSGDRPYKCDTCGKSFTEGGSLKKHSLTHSGVRPYKCDVCGKSYAVSDSLKRHLVMHSGERPHKCEVCGKSFTRINSLKAHSITHFGEEPHVCEVCGKAFTYPWNLRAHALLHIGEKRYKCDICVKSFTHSGSLKAHKLIHSGERPHECDVCGKTFTESGTLKKHSLIHTGERPHKCNVCGKSFTEASTLRKHMVTHTGERPYQCHICGKSFTQSSSLKAHTMTHIIQSTDVL